MAQDERGNLSWGGIALIVIGGAFLLHNLDLIELHDVWRFWPLLLIAIGVRLLLDRRRRASAASEVNQASGPPGPPASS